MSIVPKHLGPWDLTAIIFLQAGALFKNPIFGGGAPAPPSLYGGDGLVTHVFKTARCAPLAKH